jgi:hypothetical protein
MSAGQFGLFVSKYLGFGLAARVVREQENRPVDASNGLLAQAHFLR